MIEVDRYFLRRRWDSFVRHLPGVEPPVGYEIADPSRRDVVAGSQ